MYAYETGVLISQTTPQTIIAQIFPLEEKNSNVTRTKATPSSWIRANDKEALRIAIYLFTYPDSHMTSYQLDIRLLRTKSRLETYDKNTKAPPTAGRRREHGLGRYLQDRAARTRSGMSSNQRTGR